MPVSMGCSWNVSLIEEIYKAIVLECRTMGIDVLFAPVLNMWTDPRFGRASEGVCVCVYVCLRFFFLNCEIA